MDILKYLHKLKNKHGFTLVELIVVVAIIGVLAAILTPMMIGVVIKARVTSANSTAKGIKNGADVMIAYANATYFSGINRGIHVFNITVNTSKGKTTWTCSAAESSDFFNSGDLTWGSGGTFVTGDDPDSVTTGEGYICAALSDTMSSLHKGSIVVVLANGKCTFVAYTQNTSDAIPETEYPPIVDGIPPLEFEWDGNTEGVSPKGWVIGTYPQIAITKKK